MACCGGKNKMSINETGDPYEAYGRRDAKWVSDSEGSRPIWGMAPINGRKQYYGYHDVGDVFLVFDADIIAQVNGTNGSFVAPNGQEFIIDGTTIHDPTVPLESITASDVVEEVPDEPELIEDEPIFKQPDPPKLSEILLAEDPDEKKTPLRRRTNKK